MYQARMFKLCDAFKSSHSNWCPPCTLTRIVLCSTFLQTGNNIADEKPENRPEIDERLEKLNIKWQELADASKQKGTKLGDAQKQEEFNTGVQNIQQWFAEVEQTVVTHEKATDLTTATRLYQKHKVSFEKSEKYKVLFCGYLKIKLVKVIWSCFRFA